MSRKRYKPEQIIGMLRQTEVELTRGKRIGEVCRSLGISEQSYYRWRSEYSGLKFDPARLTAAIPPMSDCNLLRATPRRVIR